MPRISIEQTFTALKYPNYRLWFAGQMASLFGTWMQSTAQGYLIYELTGSAAYLGYVGFALGAPSWLFMLYGGVISDRMSRRKLMIITQSSMMVLALVLSALTFTGVVQPWHIIILAFLLGIVNAFDTPARQSFTIELVSHEDLGNAIALNSAMFNTGTAIGPAIAGVAYALWGPGWCFLINAVSFIAVIQALWKMKLEPLATSVHKNSSMEDLKQGLKYIHSQHDIRSLLLIVGMTIFLGYSYNTLIPEWAVDVLKGDSMTNGFLQSARGVGSLMGALIIASLGRFQFRGKLLMAGLVSMPVLLMTFSAVRWLPLSLFMLVLVGLSFMFLVNMCNNLIQSLTTDELRGRVMGMYSLILMGMMPVGSLAAGYLAQALGSPLTVLMASGLMLVFALIVWLVLPNVRRLS